MGRSSVGGVNEHTFEVNCREIKGKLKQKGEEAKVMNLTSERPTEKGKKGRRRIAKDDKTKIA